MEPVVDASSGVYAAVSAMAGTIIRPVSDFCKPFSVAFNELISEIAQGKIFDMNFPDNQNERTAHIARESGKLICKGIVVICAYSAISAITNLFKLAVLGIVLPAVGFKLCADQELQQKFVNKWNEFWGSSTQVTEAPAPAPQPAPVPSAPSAPIV